MSANIVLALIVVGFVVIDADTGEVLTASQVKGF